VGSNPSAQRQGRLDYNAVERHLQIGTGNAVSMDIALERRRLAERLIDIGPVNLCCMRLRGERQH
jgi:hypothetical protein